MRCMEGRGQFRDAARATLRFRPSVKPVWMFDSFQGLPPAKTRDGQRALLYQQESDAPHYFDNCRAALEDVRASAAALGLGDKEAIIVPGWFAESFPRYRSALEEVGIALLQVDCDWYDPVSYVYEHFVPLVSDGGPIIIDDYYAWDGCARATHDFLTRHDYPWRIRSIENCRGAWMIKSPPE